MFINSLFHWLSVDAERPSDIVNSIDCIFHSFVGLSERIHPETPHIEDLLYFIFFKDKLFFTYQIIGVCACVCMPIYIYIIYF